MTPFAFVFDPGTIAAWLVVGLVSSWLAVKLIEAPSYGTIGDIGLGCMGALIGALSFGFFANNFWGSMLVAFIGACVFIGAARIIVAIRNA